MNWEDILLNVEKPSRYIGAEVNAVRKDRTACKLSFALAFPDTYEVGMSHLGLQILYAILNDIPNVVAERCYAPWPDMEAHLRSLGIPLSSLESHTALSQFDVVGFSLQYELSHTNVLNMLDMGGIPIRSADRGEGHPIVIAGGPCCFNPAPMSRFIDAFVIGEGENIIREIVRSVIAEKEKGASRNHILNVLAAISGVYVPQIHTKDVIIEKRIVADLNDTPFPMNPVMPLMKTIHDRVTLEIARGCTRGCRFCQAGMVWRPVRERNPGVLIQMADRMLTATGCDELSLLSLSTGDYSLIEPLFVRLANRYAEQKVALSLPSMRVETLTARMIEEIKRVRKTSFTLAPEAGTQRLRDIINKGNTEEDLLTTTRRVFEAGWKSIKLYFMLGLPGEGEEDLEGIVDLGYKCLREGKNRGQVTVSLSTFVPKAHTPFQWQRQISIEETIEKQAHFKKRLKHRMLNVKWHDSRMSLLEGIFSRGDTQIGELIEKAYRLGCRFDGWSDRFRFDLWEKAIEETGVVVDDCLRERRFSEALPWDNIDCGVTTDFLKEEAEKSLTGESTADCRFASCSDCGVCDQKNICMITAEDDMFPDDQIKAPVPVTDPSTEGEKRLRITFHKKDQARFLSHLEISTALIRAINRSGLEFIYSQGFHPHPKISFATATPVGMESMGEFAEMHVRTWPNREGNTLPRLRDNINTALPTGIRIIAVKEIPLNGKTLFDLVKGFTYRMEIPDNVSNDVAAAFHKKIARFLNAEEFTITRESKGKTVIKNIRPLVRDLAIDPQSRAVILTAMLGAGGATVRPVDILTEVLGLDDDAAKTIRVIKTDTCFSNS
jgi:radical SAM family uncharacterized protein/radical SAM-linked protein